MPQAIQTVWKKIYTEISPSNAYEHAGTAELEVYLPGESYKEDYISEVWMPIK